MSTVDSLEYWLRSHEAIVGLVVVIPFGVSMVIALLAVAYIAITDKSK